MIDKKKIKKAVNLILEAIGENINTKDLINTPERVANFYQEFFFGLDKNKKNICDISYILNKTFDAPNNNLIIQKDIDFYSMCEHHLLPFYGQAHIAYVPDKKILGLSKLARTVEIFSRRLQIQERLTCEIADAINKYLNPKGVIVFIKAKHMCMTMRGVKKNNSNTITIAKHGIFNSNKNLLDIFFRAINYD